MAVVGEVTGERNHHLISSCRGRYGEENLFDVISIIDACSRRSVHGSFGPRADERHDIGLIFGTSGSDDFEVEVID